MKKTNGVYSFLLCACAYFGWGCASFLFQTQECQAKLIIGFQFTDGSTNKVVPQTGGTYTVNIVASTDNPLTTNLGVNSGYVGALSQILNGSTIDGDITARTLIAGLQADSGFFATLSDINADNRIDLGAADGTPKTSAWMRPSTATVNAALLGGPTGVIGTFTVTIPAYTYFGDNINFLSYLPQIDPTSSTIDWSWTENNTNTSASLLAGTVTGPLATNPGTVIVGSSITFTAVPEPATWSLLGVMLGSGFYWRRRK